MTYVILSPYSHTMANGAKNPKTYPWWQSVVDSLISRQKKIVQVGRIGETPLRGTECVFSRPLNDIMSMIDACETWASVDNFFPHMCSHTSKSGVVVWSRSDPLIFGYPHNTNLLKSRHFLRPDQFGRWTDCQYIEDAFVSPELVTEAILAKCI